MDSSGSDDAGESWDKYEERLMQAYDKRVDELHPPAASAAAPAAHVEGSQAARPTAAASQAQAASSDLLRPGDATYSGDASRIIGVEDAPKREAFLAACMAEPYKPEDHICSAEDMWAGFSSSDDDAAGPVDKSGRAAEVQRTTPSPVTAASVLRESAPRVTTPATQTAGTAESCRAAPETRRPHALPPDERLRRLLSGPNAAERLGDLSFKELSWIADDCQLAMTTMQWVLHRQRALLGHVQGDENRKDGRRANGGL